jgi:hypothetical protein
MVEDKKAENMYSNKTEYYISNFFLLIALET